MKVTLLLADAVQAVGGKLYVLGGGWSICGPDPTQMAIGVKVEVPWDRAGRSHGFRLALEDADGGPVTVPGHGGDKAVSVEGTFNVGRPDGVPAGTPIDVVLAINVGALRLPTGQRYVWRLFVDDETSEDWYLGFYVRPASSG